MKLKAIAHLCAKVKQIVLFDDGNGAQWISDGAAVYRLPETLGMLTPGAVTAMFDIAQEKAADYKVDRGTMPASLNQDDEAPGERELNFELTCRINFAGRDLLPLSDKDGRVFLIQTKYCKPLEDAEQIRFFLREDGEHPPVIAAKDGLFIQALIMPTDLDFAQTVSRWANGIAAGLATQAAG